MTKTNSLREHFIKTKAAKAAAQAVQDPRLSARLNRPLGNVMVRQTTPITDASPNAAFNPEHMADGMGNIELQFYNHWEQLSGIQSISHKKELKAEFLPHYLPWIEGTIAEGVGPQNDMLLKLMVWCLDTHDFNTAVNIAEYALLNDFAMPEPFSRDVATVFVEQLSDELLKNVDDVAVHADLIARAIDITTAHDMPDQVRAKLYRAYGNALKDTKPDDAVIAYERALTLDDSVGCKKDLAALRKHSE